MSWWSAKYDPIQAGSIDGTDITPHDRAITRAINANYNVENDKKITGDPYRTLFVARLDWKTTEETIRQVFSKYGKIEHMRLVRDIVTGASRGYAFITYEREDDFREAYFKAHKITIDGRQILVDFERERTMEGWVPRRYGGGLGGRKESGQLRFGGRDRPFKIPIPARVVEQSELDPHDAEAVAQQQRQIDNLREERSGRAIFKYGRDHGEANLQARDALRGDTDNNNDDENDNDEYKRRRSDRYHPYSPPPSASSAQKHYNYRRRSRERSEERSRRSSSSSRHDTSSSSSSRDRDRDKDRDRDRRDRSDHRDHHHYHHDRRDRASSSSSSSSRSHSRIDPSSSSSSSSSDHRYYGHHH